MPSLGRSGIGHSAGNRRSFEIEWDYPLRTGTNQVMKPCPEALRALVRSRAIELADTLLDFGDGDGRDEKLCAMRPKPAGQIG